MHGQIHIKFISLNLSSTYLEQQLFNIRRSSIQKSLQCCTVLLKTTLPLPRPSIFRILSATKFLLRCVVNYCKLIVQNSSWWWTVTCSKHVEDKLSEINSQEKCASFWTLVFFFFFQLYNSLWVLACSIISFHCFLSCVLCFQLVTPIFLKSFLTSSSHLTLGLPFSLVAYGFHLYMVLATLSLVILSTCPNQLSSVGLCHLWVSRCTFQRMWRLWSNMRM